MGEAKSDLEISLLLGKRLNPEAWPWETAEDFYEEHCFNSLGKHFDELKEAVCYQIPYEYKKYERGLMRPDGYPGWNSSTAMVEFRSTYVEDYGEDPLPYFKECPYAPVEDAPLHDERYPLSLTTGMRKYTSFHSEHRQVASLREIDPLPWATINPADAQKYGIVDGEWITIENMFGKCNMKVEVRNNVKEGVVVASHAWWFPEQEGSEPHLYGLWDSDVNKLIPNRLCSPLGFGSIHDNMCCTIYPCKGQGDGIEPPSPRLEKPVMPAHLQLVRDATNMDDPTKTVAGAKYYAEPAAADAGGETPAAAAGAADVAPATDEN